MSTSKPQDKNQKTGSGDQQASKTQGGQGASKPDAKPASGSDSSGKSSSGGAGGGSSGTGGKSAGGQSHKNDR